jgi:hypothetical protein
VFSLHPALRAELEELCRELLELDSEDRGVIRRWLSAPRFQHATPVRILGGVSTPPSDWGPAVEIELHGLIPAVMWDHDHEPMYGVFIRFA